MFSRTALFVCDLQQRVIPRIRNSDGIIKSVNTLMQCNSEYRKYRDDPTKPDGSIVVAEFLSNKLGPTDTRIIQGLPDNHKLLYEKPNYTMFDDHIDQYLKHNKINHVVLTGVQTEWCITQSAIDFQKNGYGVDVIRDGVGSFCTEEHEDALDRLKKRGVMVYSTHSWIVERLRTAKHPVSQWYLENLKARLEANPDLTTKELLI